MTSRLPLGNDGKPDRYSSARLGFIPKGAKNVEVAKDFLQYLIQPTHLDDIPEEARGRWLPLMPSIVKNDPCWLDPKDPHRAPYVEQGAARPDRPRLLRLQSRPCAGARRAVWGRLRRTSSRTA